MIKGFVLCIYIWLVLDHANAYARPYTLKVSTGLGTIATKDQGQKSFFIDQSMIGSIHLYQQLSKIHIIGLEGSIEKRISSSKDSISDEASLLINQTLSEKNWSYKSAAGYTHYDSDLQSETFSPFYPSSRIFFDNFTSHHLTNRASLSLGLVYTSEVIQKIRDQYGSVTIRFDRKHERGFQYNLEGSYLSNGAFKQKAYTYRAGLGFTWMLSNKLHINGKFRKFLSRTWFQRKRPEGYLRLSFQRKTSYFELSYFDQISTSRGPRFQEWNKGYSFYAETKLASNQRFKTSLSQIYFIDNPNRKMEFRYWERRAHAGYEYLKPTKIGQLGFGIDLEGSNKISSSTTIDTKSIRFTINLIKHKMTRIL